MDDIYTSAGGYMGTEGSNESMETKQVPGYVPAPLVNPDVVERPAAEGEEADTGKTAADEKSGSAKTSTKTGTSK
jgi:hypothetical protein